MPKTKTLPPPTRAVDATAMSIQSVPARTPVVGVTSEQLQAAARVSEAMAAAMARRLRTPANG